MTNSEILEILEAKNSELDWQNDYLNTIIGSADIFESKKDVSIQRKVEDYFRNTLPLHWKVFHTITQHYRNQGILKIDKYEIGIFIVGFSELPIILSLLTLKPQKIYFLYSPESSSTLPWIEKGLNQINADFWENVKGQVNNE